MNSVPLQDICKRISSGLTPLRSNNEFWNSPDIDWVKTEQLGEKNIYNSNERISKRALDQTGLKLYPKNTLSIAMYGEGRTRGSISILRKEMTTNQACCNLEIDESKAHYEYVYYFLRTQYIQLRNLSSGVRKNLNSNDIKRFEIRLPNLEDQLKISKVLSGLDKKIELNNRINQELEGMAKLLYDYWFVQFDFPISEEQAIAMGKPELKEKPYKSSGGPMVYNEQLKREIPEGWEVKKLADSCIRIQSGGTPTSTNNEYYNGNINWFNTQELQDNFLFTSNNLINKKAISESSAKLFPRDTVVIAIYASPTVGRLGILTRESSFNQACCGLVVDSSLISKEYLYLTLKLNRKQLNTVATGTSQKNLGVATIKNLEIVVPNRRVMEAFNKTINVMFERIKISGMENKQLNELRDWLLPLLMNGQVRVGEAKKQRGVLMATEEGANYKN